MVSLCTQPDSLYAVGQCVREDLDRSRPLSSGTQMSTAKRKLRTRVSLIYLQSGRFHSERIFDTLNWVPFTGFDNTEFWWSSL